MRQQPVLWTLPVFWVEPGRSRVEPMPVSGGVSNTIKGKGQEEKEIRCPVEVKNVFEGLLTLNSVHLKVFKT